MFRFLPLRVPYLIGPDFNVLGLLWSRGWSLVKIPPCNQWDEIGIFPSASFSTGQSGNMTTCWWSGTGNLRTVPGIESFFSRNMESFFSKSIRWEREWWTKDWLWNEHCTWSVECGQNGNGTRLLALGIAGSSPVINWSVKWTFYFYSLGM